MMPSANIVPALGPPMSSMLIVTSTGMSNVGSMKTPICAPPSSFVAGHDREVDRLPVPPDA